MENLFVATEDLIEKLGKKKILYDILTIDSKHKMLYIHLVGLLLPPYHKCPISFMRDIFAKKKMVSIFNSAVMT
jgi:hypothetical protein